MSKKVLFIDRDGTIIKEPEDFQIDSFDKLAFLPYAISSLSKIALELDYELVLVSNQDGLGSSSFPEDTFFPVQNFILTTLEAEGVVFSDIYIDPSFECQGSQNRKPGLGMLGKYVYGQYDLANSFVIGDRLTDIQLAHNLGTSAIYIGEQQNAAALSTVDWREIYQFLKGAPRKATLKRETSETKINLQLNLDDSSKTSIDTGLAFFDHMLDQLSRHGNIGLQLKVVGDLKVDEHHTIEDTALALGQGFNMALGQKKAIERYGFVVPMDDCLAEVAIDFSGRSWLVWQAEFGREKVGDMPTEMFYHFFKSFCDAAKCNLNIRASGKNEHHKIESIFKAFAKAIKMAVSKNSQYVIPSTKGVL